MNFYTIDTAPQRCPKRKRCPGSKELPIVVSYKDNKELMAGIMMHYCPYCGRNWARNNMQDWSKLPVPVHYIAADLCLV